MSFSRLRVIAKIAVTLRGQFKKAVALLLAALLVCPAAQSQRERSVRTSPSDLASENLNRVGASPGQIEEVLRKEPGLLVELKRWVAKEATDQGQIVDDTDLSDQAIFDRLSRDLPFRALATRLLQRYGYLIPKLNPDSELAKEQDLVRKERAHRLAKAEAEEEDATDRRRTDRGLEPTVLCDPLRERHCAEEERPQLQSSKQSLYGRELPGEPNSPDLQERVTPRQGRGNSPRLVQTGSEDRAGLSVPLMQRPGEPFSSPSERAATLEESEVARVVDRREGETPFDKLPEGRTHLSPGSSLNSRKEGERNRPAATMVRRPNPYADIPSLYDMYLQASARQPVMERFGTDVFRRNAPDSQLVPMDLPVGSDYVVGPGDGLAIDIWGGVSQRLVRTVDREGRLTLPEVGPILVSGRALGEVQQAVQRILRTQFRDVSADVSLSRLRTIRVYVVGDVENPGAYDISSLSTPINALFAASGPTERGSLRTLRHFRGKQLVQEVDVYDLLLHGVRSDLKRLENGDTLLVPPLGPQITVEGMLRRPSIYELRGEKTLAEVLELAGGILPTATLRHIEVQRIEAHQKRTMLSVDLSDAQDGNADEKRLESIAIQDGDEVHIFPIAPHNQDAVYLQGHVLRPGRYAFQPDMRVTDLVSSYKDLLPEPEAKYAEIIRLNPPDYRPNVESFHLGAALANPASAPKLLPLDTVRIFSRYDFEDPPSFSVGGEVRSPGTYRTPGEAHLRDAIQFAGGLTPDAVLDSAQLMRTMPDGSLKVLNINLEQALAGNPTENILLLPRDRLLIHPNPIRVDPPSVVIKGEVAKPGRYLRTSNLRVEDLIRLAGGLLRSAYTESADLTRYLAKSEKQTTGEHLEINLPAALAGDPSHDLGLRDGDVLTIRQLPGWRDIGASVTVRGEVEHPGVYGIRPGERLSSVLKRAGAFRPTAYPQAAVFERIEVRELQEKSKQELIQRVEQSAGSVKVSLSEDAKGQAELQQAALHQRERVLEALRKARVTGRLVIRLGANLAAFENSPDDIEVRAGDALFIPKRPDFVLVTGQVYNSNAITHVPRKNAAWYLQQAGGITSLAEKKAIFVVRANGSVVTGKEERWWGSGGVLSARIEPGDTIIVPEKAIGQSSFWKNLLPVAQLVQGSTIAATLIRK